MRRKFEQVKAYSKIIKYKRNTGQTEEVQQPNHNKQKEEKLEEEGAIVDMPKNEDFED